jgi:hypothetical protein
MNSSVKMNIEKIKKQLNNSTIVNVMKSKNIVSNKKPLKKIVKSVKDVKKPIKMDKTYMNSSNNSWDFLSILLLLVLLFFIVVIIYNIYLYLVNKQSDNQIDITIDKEINETPDGVVINQEGAPISVEENDDITENKYLSLYDGDNYLKQVLEKPFNEYTQYSTYQGYNNLYPNRYNKYNRYGPGYYSQTDNGITKIYYEKVRDFDNSELNNYIKDQNQYIKDVNKRVKQINNNRMNTPTYSRDKAILNKIRKYERKLANQVHRESKNQTYLPDQNIYYQ